MRPFNVLLSFFLSEVLTPRVRSLLCTARLRAGSPPAQFFPQNPKLARLLSSQEPRRLEDPIFQVNLNSLADTNRRRTNVNR